MRTFLKRLIPETLKRPVRSYLHNKRLSYSQGGQDIWVFGEVFDEKQAGFFVDVGAHDGIYLSNTYVLERRFHWKGICIEANPTTFGQLTKNRTATCVHACIDAEERLVEFKRDGLFGKVVDASGRSYKELDRGKFDNVLLNSTTLCRVLNDHGAPTEIDYLSMDIEGAEERAFSRFPFDHYKIKCMTIERPTATLKRQLESNGFVMIKEIPGLDCFYIHSSHINRYLENVFSFYEKKYYAIRVG